MIKVGDKIPSATLRRMNDSGIEEVQTSDYFAGRKIAMIGVPGAFTPTCSQQHLPGYIQKAADFKGKGVDEIACLSVNDPFVMQEWGKASGAEGKVTLLADGNGEFTKAMGLEFDGSGAGLGTRSKRFAMIVEDGVVKSLHVEDSPGALQVTGAEKLIEEV
ncbi:peroxiredoxin [Ferruginivarius sediminum]|uniref:Glutathione-dependent peroxiredoxin n=1 Tax=Ferruginivarius sediminum TaxID=2661937 RepID=A0A369TDY1_9PROT|nr:peroxiredoxin [Ferruginivarius sediminum]RDD63539.1 peroxiredoxin [Ferruginivarius sediminum]